MKRTRPASPLAGPGLSPQHLVDHVIRPTLAVTDDGAPGWQSQSAVELLVGTAAVESGLRALDQWTGLGDRALGPAIGLWQIEPATRHDVHVHYLAFRAAQLARVTDLLAGWPDPDVQLATNLVYACAIARLIYRRSPVRLAAPGDVGGHAAVWKAVFNTHLGRGTPADFVSAWERLGLHRVRFA